MFSDVATVIYTYLKKKKSAQQQLLLVLKVIQKVFFLELQSFVFSGAT